MPSIWMCGFFQQVWVRYRSKKIHIEVNSKRFAWIWPWEKERRASTGLGNGFGQTDVFCGLAGSGMAIDIGANDQGNE